MSVSLDSTASKQMTAWMLRLPTRLLFQVLLAHDPHVFGLWYAACASAHPPPDALVADEHAGEIETDRLLSVLKTFQQQFGTEASGLFARRYLEGMGVLSQSSGEHATLFDHVERWQQDAATEADGYVTSLEENLRYLGALVDLTIAEQRILELQALRTTPAFVPLLEALFRDELTLVPALATMLDVDDREVIDALDAKATLVRLGLVHVQRRPLRLSSPSRHLVSVLSEVSKSEQAFHERFVKPLSPQGSTASLGGLHGEDERILTELLAAPVGEAGQHTLVYGPKTVDKRDMLARLFDRHGLDGYLVATRDVPASDLPAWIGLAQRWMLAHAPDGVLVIDRAEGALSSRTVSIMSIFGAEEVADEDDERDSDEGLTSTPVRCVWTTDHHGFLTEQNIGRFLFHCEARPGSRADRRERIKAVIASADLSATLERDLSKYALLGERQVRQAVALAAVLGGDVEDSERVVRRAVQQSQRALKRDRTEELRESVTGYSLDFLNLSGRFSPQQIVTALRQRPSGTLCFYGLPGAGKTQLAEYLAVELDKPIMMKRASDLLSKWLGESEQNIAAMFAEAEAEGALLLLDESDSFLRDRSLARAEWAVSQTNELLQHMERYDGVFIAATNLFRDIDAAALRRFNFKIEFLALTPAQAWEMYRAESGLAGEAMAAAHSEDDLADLQARLAAVGNLTPGDFATVKRQSLMLGEDLDPAAWIEQLAEEAKAKMIGLERNKLGFG